MSKEVRVAPGIWKTPYGWRVFVDVRGRSSKRFSPQWTLPKLRAWRQEHIVLLKRQRCARRGTFAADALVYLQAVAAMPSYADRERDVQAWIATFGPRLRHTITSVEIAAQLQAWRLKKAASTCNHRRTALLHLYTTLDGKDAGNPVRAVPPFKEPPPEKRGIPLDQIAQMVDGIVAKRTRARLAILAWTGQRPAELMRAKPGDVDIEERVWWVRGAKGGAARDVPLSDAAVKAWQAFVALDAWGPFSVSTARKFLHASARRLNLPQIRVYDLRHSLASAFRRAGADLADIQAHLGHSTLRMTRRYAPEVAAKLRRMVDQTANPPEIRPSQSLQPLEPPGTGPQTIH